MKRFIMMGVAFSLLVLGFWPAQAQTPATITSQSGRITLTYPEGWVASNTVQADVQRFFESEALTIAESQAIMDQVALGPNIGGSHLVVAMFPMLDVYPINPNPQDFGEVIDGLFGQANPTVVEFEVSGFPGAYIEQNNGVVFGIVGLGNNVLAMSAQAINEEDRAMLVEVITGVQIRVPQDRFDADNLTTTLVTSDERASFPSGEGWYSGTRGVGSLMLHYTAPLAGPIQDVIFGLSELGSLESLFFGVIQRSYFDFARFFDLEWVPTESDLATVLDLTLSEINLLAVGEEQSFELGDYTAVQRSLQSGENIGQAIAVDGGHSIYIAFSLYPSGRSAELAPLAQAIFAKFALEPLAPEVAALPPEGLAVGYRAPNFRTIDLNGEAVSLTDLQGQVVMLNFWFTTCPPCREEMPAMQAVYEEYQGDGFTVLAVNNADAPTEVEAFADQFGLSFPIALDSTARIQRVYQILSYPTSLFVDGDGIIYAVENRALSAEQIRALVQEGLSTP